MLIVKNDKIF